MSFDITSVVTSADSSEVHRAVIAALRTCSFDCDEDTVKPPVRFLAANPQLKNKDSIFGDFNSDKRYPSITVFAFQPLEGTSRYLGTLKAVEETPGEPGHYDIIKYPMPTPFTFRYQINLATERQDHQDMLGMKVKGLLWVEGGSKALMIKGRNYEVSVTSLTTRVFPEEGVQVEDLEWSITVPVVFIERSQRLPMVEEFIVNVGIPEWYESLTAASDMESI